MRTVIIHGRKVSPHSPRAGREDCELWGVTRANARGGPHFWGGKLTDWTRWFDLHPLTQTDRFPGIPERRPDAWAWYCAQDGSRPIYLQGPEYTRPANRALAEERFRMVRGAVSFPVREVQAAFPVDQGRGPEPNRWFIEQTGFMIAFALLEGFERIILNGIGTMTTMEFKVAHETILYWMAFARGRGAEVFIEGPSIYKMPGSIYAFEKFNYDELAQARQERRDIARREDLSGWDELNEKERRRGRPLRRRFYQ